uniref:Uncharacterized protein n=2 Tax=Nothobranchius furzeri TaxID=105023 RepID=A0A1A8AB31_NOTFU
MVESPVHQDTQLLKSQVFISNYNHECWSNETTKTLNSNLEDQHYAPESFVIIFSNFFFLRLKTSCWASRSLPPQQLSVCSFCAPCYPALMPAVAVEVAAVVLVEVVVVDTAVGGVVSPTDPHPSRYLSRTEVQVQGRWLELQLQEQ